jgi:hypothetical protein
LPGLQFSNLAVHGADTAALRSHFLHLRSPGIQTCATSRLPTGAVARLDAPSTSNSGPRLCSCATARKPRAWFAQVKRVVLPPPSPRSTLPNECPTAPWPVAQRYGPTRGSSLVGARAGRWSIASLGRNDWRACSWPTWRRGGICRRLYSWRPERQSSSGGKLVSMLQLSRPAPSFNADDCVRGWGRVTQAG